MYRVCFETERAVELQCDSLERALEVVRTLVEDICVLPSGDDTFWLCCRSLEEGDCDVVARIFRDEQTQEGALENIEAGGCFPMTGPRWEEFEPRP